MTRSMRNAVVLAAFAGGLGLASAANAQTQLLSMTYDDLGGNYVAGGVGPVAGTFSANAVNINSPRRLRTSGDVSRLVATEDTAYFDPGFVTLPDLADFGVSLTVENLTATTATGSGAFVSTDADGDTITGNISGQWLAQISPGGAVFVTFSGIVTNVVLNDNGALDGTYNGSSGGAFDLDLPGTGPYEGAVVVLSFGQTNFFTSNFSNIASSFSAQIVPAPGALALVGLGGLAMARRRR